MRSISGGNIAFEKTVTRQFIDNVPNHLQQLIAAYQKNDFPTVKIRAHDFKTSIAMLGLLDSLEEKLDMLETVTAQNAALQLVLDELTNSLTSAVAEARVFLQEL